MTKITFEDAKQALEKTLNKADQSAKGAVNEMYEEQPDLIDFLMRNIEDEELEEVEQSKVLFLGISIWKAYKEAGESLPVIKWDTIDQKEKENDEIIEKLDQDNKDEADTGIAQLVENHSQPELIRFAILIFMETDDRTPQNLSIMFILIKTFIDSIEASRAT